MHHILSHPHLTLQVLLTPLGRLKLAGLGVGEALRGEAVPSTPDRLLAAQRDDVLVRQTVGAP
jgi:hypothetical protein